MKYNYIVEGNSEEVLKKIPSEFVDIVITSPPYNVAHNYDDYEDNLESEEYWALMKEIFSEIKRVLKKDGRVCLNVPFAIKNRKTKEVSFLATKFSEILNDLDFKDFEWITWHKGRNINHFQGNNTAWGSWKSPSSPSFRPMGEAVLVFYKETKRLVRDKDKIDITGDEFKNWTKNVWYFDDETNKAYEQLLTIPNTASKKIHPAPYPTELIERLLKMYSYEEAIVLDPFNGIGTTSIASENFGRKFIGIEQSKLYCDLAYEQLNKDKTKRVSIDNFFSKLVHPGDVKGTLNEFFPYKESYSPSLLQGLKKRYNIENSKSIYDPFTGTGSTFTNMEVEDIYGVDVSPFALNVTKAKLVPLSDKEFKLGKKFVNHLDDLVIKEFEYPKWKPYSKYANKYKYNIVMTIIDLTSYYPNNLSRFIQYLIYSNLDKIFDYKRDGNGIKYRQSKVQNENTLEYLKDLISSALISKQDFDKENCLKKIDLKIESSTKNIIEEGVDIIVTSPPYANMFDYFEVYKMELWTSKIINTHNDWKLLKKSALRSNMNSALDEKDMVDNSTLKLAIDKLEERDVEKRIITMLYNYFYDMNKTIKNMYFSLKEGAYAFIVVGNSFYKGVPIPTDFILEELSKNIGFECVDIIFSRKLNTSPQQMKIISENDKQYLRESIIVLRKE